MDANRFDSLTKDYAAGAISRRATLKGLALGAFIPLFGRFAEDAEAGCDKGVCAKRNWCVDRTHTCGPAGGYGKCLVKKFGGKNVCAEILFQAQTCTDCEEPNCTDCVCVLAAGGGDRCNNGANGYDFVCARKVPASL